MKLFLFALLLTLIASPVQAQTVQGYWDDIFAPEEIGGNGITSQVYTVAMNPLTGDVYAGGEFNMADGRNKIVRWNGSEWVALGMGVNSTVYALEFGPDGTLYVGGGFTTATQTDGTSIVVNRIASWDGTTWAPLGNGASGTVWDIEYDEANDRLFIGGDFPDVTNEDNSVIASSAIAYWENDSWNPVGQGADAVRSVGVDPSTGDVLIGGQFLDEGYNTDGTVVIADGLARWNGSTWSAFGQPNGYANAFRFSDTGELFVAGSFTLIGGVNTRNIARYSAGTWHPVGTLESGPVDQAVNDIFLNDDGLFAAGRFTEIRQEDGTVDDIERIAYFDFSTGMWLPMGPTRHADSFVNAIAGNSNELWFVGPFSNLGGRLAYRVNRWFRTNRSFDTTVSTFEVDLRSVDRHGVLMNKVMLDVATGDAAGLYVLDDLDGDTIYTVVAEQHAGATIEYSYLIDSNGNAMDEDVAWYRELDPPVSLRQVSIPATGPFVVPLSFFDDRDPAGPESGFTSNAFRGLYATLTGRRFLDFGLVARTVYFELDHVDRPSAWSIHEYQMDPGGVPPAGIARIADHALWKMELWPASSNYSMTLDWEYHNITGIRDANDLRMLFRPDPQSPWSVVPTEVIAEDKLLRVPNVTEVSGEWTLASTSADNQLTILQPAVAENPLPGDGGLNVPTTTTLRWEALDVSEYELFLWPQDGTKPSSPTARPDDPEYVASGLIPDTWYNWTVTSTNIHGEVEGPVWSFRVGTAPDLVVDAVSVAPTAFSGQTIEVSWDIRNDGNGGTNAPRWYDDVYLSDNTTLDSEDLKLASANNLSFLNPGEVYSNLISVPLPDGIQGTHYIIVETDPGNDLNEESETNNVLASSAVSVTLTPYADLEVTDIIAPGVVFSGDSIDVTWTVTNNGTGVSSSTHWYDTVFLSPDDSLDFNFTSSDQLIRINETALDSTGHDGELDPDSSYQVTRRLKLPDQAFGEQYLFVYADVKGDAKQEVVGEVYEFNQELDNWSSIPISITLTPPPDLTVASVDLPQNITSGELIDIVWTVENAGPGPTRTTSWSDLIYYSPIADFDTSSANILGSFRHTGSLLNDDSYVGSGLVTVPDGVSGDGYFFVRADWKQEVFEHEFEDNNLEGFQTPTPITLAPYPDLQISDLTISPLNTTAGQQVVARYEVVNMGNAGTDAWSDSVFISSSQSWDRELASPVGVTFHNTPLDELESRSHTATVTIPPDASGNYYLYIVANASESVFEYPNVDGNVTGAGIINVESYPSVMLTAEANHMAGAVASGETISLNYVVSNTGQGTTLTSEWTDAAYLSADENLDIDLDILVNRFNHIGPVAGGGSYTVSRDVQIPNGLEGSYYLIVKPDIDDQVVEALSVQPSVSELPVTLPSPVDLRVTEINIPVSLQASQPATVTWRVENEGSGATGTDRWFDTVYLSDDLGVGSSDVVLGYLEHDGSLDAGAGYDGSLDVTIPSYSSGSYYILVDTDSRDDVYEHVGESNNAGSFLFDLTLPPPADLTVSNIQIPSVVTPGNPVSVSWTLENVGVNPATGVIREGIFVSSDQQWSPDDALVGVIEETINIAPNVSTELSAEVQLSRSFQVNANGEISGAMPGVAPGAYYIIIRTDIGGAIRESDITNNTVSSSSTFSAETDILDLGNAAPLTLNTASTRYFHVEIPEDGQDVKISLDQVEESSGSTTLFIRHEAIPAPTMFDASSSIPFETSQTVTLSEAPAGNHFIMVQANDMPEGEETFDLTAEVLEYSLANINPSVGGNTGIVTVRLDGAQFEQGSTVVLEDALGERIEAFETVVQSTTVARARFNLRGAPVGFRDLIIIAPGGSEAVLSSGFEVVEGVGAQPYVFTYYPDELRSSGVVPITVVVGNSGTENAMDVALVVGGRGRSIEVNGDGYIPPDIGMPETISLTEDFPWQFNYPKPSADSLFYTRDTDEDVLLPFWFYEIPPGAEVRFTVNVYHDIDEGFISHFAWLFESPESEFTYTGALADIETSFGYKILVEAAQEFYSEAAAETTSGTAGMGKSTQDADEAEQAIRQGLGDMASHPIPAEFTALGMIGGAVLGVLLLPEAATAGIVLATVGAGFAIGSFAGAIIDAYRLSNSASITFKDAFSRLIAHRLNVAGANAERIVNSGQTLIKKPFDPNDMIGPDGVGDRNWVGLDRPLAYTIRFENDPELASASAQVVEIRHTLDDSVDPRDFRLGTFGFGNLTFNPPANVSYYRQRLATADSIGVDIDVTAGLDIVRNEAFWIFTSIDPLTGTQPYTDPSAGFLPVNDSTGVGEGFVSFAIQASQDAQTGDRIDAQASIVFDINAPIDTPPIFNTIDANAPSSTASVIRSEADTSSFQLNLTGADVGVGLGSYALYSSKNDGPFELLQTGITDSTYLFTVDEPGSTYRVFTVASDYVGNAEALKSADEAVVVGVEATESDLPSSFALYPNYPNPFNGTTRIPYDLPEAAEVELTVYDLIGRRVSRYSKKLPAGRHEQVVDMSNHASGLYLYRLNVTTETRGSTFSDTGKLVMVK